MEKDNRFLKGIILGALLALMIVYVGMEAWELGTSLVTGGFSFRSSAGLQVDEGAVDDKLEKIQSVIDQYYLYGEDVTQEELQDGIYEGFVSGLGDPYSVYYTEEDTKNLLQDVSGIYSGIGAVLTQDIDSYAAVVMTVYQDSPAEKAGLKEDDIIIKVDDHEIKDETLTEIVSWIRGEEGTDVNLYVTRNGEEKELTATRASIEAQTVTFEMLEDNIGYIDISEFQKASYEQFKTALETLESDGMEGLVIDLRSNPGGDFETVINMLKLMLPEGVIVSTEDKDGNVEEYTGDGTHEFTKPLTVLVNEYSASASEIFAGAIQDYQVGQIVGTTTYGKGIVQQLVNLGDGTYMKVTVSEYHTPSGRSIHEIGIEPDVEIEYEYDENASEDALDNQIQKALEVVQEQIAE